MAEAQACHRHVMISGKVYRTGGTQVCIGSDFPFNMGDNDPLAKVEACGFSADDLENIQFKNAKRFLGI